MNEALKQVKDVFKDLQTTDIISNLFVKTANLHKKTNELELILVSCGERINLVDIYKFENYLRIKFKFKNAIIKIENPDYKFNLQSEWENILRYINAKYPLTRSILVNSNPICDEKKIKINLLVKGKDFLINSGFVKVLEDILLNFYGEKYKVEYVETLDEELIKKYEENARRTEKMAIELAEQEIVSLSENDSKVHKESIKKDVEASIQNNQNTKDTTQHINQPQESTVIQEPENTPLILGRSAQIREQLVKVEDLTVDSGKIALDGEIVNIMDSRELKSGKFLLAFDVYDGTSTITCKAFVQPEKVKDVTKRLKGAKGVKLEGNAQFDPFAKEIGVVCNTIIETPGKKKEKRIDNAEVKRVELHMHTQMSQMDAVTSCKDLLKRAMDWGMKSIAITDHGVVQAFPDAYKLLGRDNKDLKVIYGVEAYLVPDKTPIVSYPKGQDIDTTYCVLDLETTGFSFRTEKITEVGIMKYKNGEVIDSFETFVNPEKPIPYQVVEVTHITDDMVKDAPTIEEVFPKILEFVGDSVLVAHNADFDIGFLKHNASLLGYKLENTYLDTLRLAKDLFPTYKKYKLGIIAENLGIKVEVAHRALDDVDTTVKVFRIMMDMLKERGAKTVDDIDKVSADENYEKDAYKKLPSYHAIILAKNYVGLKNLYKLVSLSHLHYFYKKPRVLKSLYKKYSEGLMLRKCV